MHLQIYQSLLSWIFNKYCWLSNRLDIIAINGPDNFSQAQQNKIFVVLIASLLRLGCIKSKPTKAQELSWTENLQVLLPTMPSAQPLPYCTFWLISINLFQTKLNINIGYDGNYHKAFINSVVNVGLLCFLPWVHPVTMVPSCIKLKAGLTTMRLLMMQLYTNTCIGQQSF